MTVFTEGRHAAEFLLFEEGITYSRDTITVKSGAGVLAPGTVLGKVTADGKYVPANAAEVVGEEGAEVAIALNLYEVDATAADVAIAAVTRNAEVSGKLIAYDTSVNDDAKKAAKAAQLKAVGIVVR